MPAGLRLRAIRECMDVGRDEFAKNLNIKKKSLEAMEMERQRVTEEVFLGVGKLYPDFAYWFVTGETDANNGHVSPDIHRHLVVTNQLKNA